MTGAGIPEYATPWTDIDVIDKINLAVIVTLEDSLTTTDSEGRVSTHSHVKRSEVVIINKLLVLYCINSPDGVVYGLQTQTIFSFQNASGLSFSQ